jgi:hypothetical protein
VGYWRDEGAAAVGDGDDEDEEGDRERAEVSRVFDWECTCSGKRQAQEQGDS